MKLIIIVWLQLVVLAFVVFLCESETRSQVSQPVAIKFAEIDNTDTAGELAGAHLDGLAARLQQSPGDKGLIIAYGPEGELSGSGKYWLERASEYLELRIHTRDRIIPVYGGLAPSISDIKLEFWLVPPGAPLPKPSPAKIDIDSFRGKVGGGWGYEGPEVHDLGGPAPGDVTMAAFAQVLRHQPKSIGYVVAHSNAAPGSWRRIGEYNVQLLAGYGIAADRLKIFHGKNTVEPSREFWVLPQNESLPLIQAAPDRLRKKAAMIHEYYEYQLSSPEDQDLAFRGFADLLMEYPGAKIYFMIMPSFPEDKEEGATNDPDKYVPSKVDFHRIVKSWKTKLKSDLNINPNRVIVVSPTKVDEILYGKMHAWIVPANAKLPAAPKVSVNSPIYDR